MTVLTSPLADAILATFDGGLVPAEDLTIYEIARAVGRPYTDVELKFALEGLQRRGVLHLYGRRWHTMARRPRNAIHAEVDA